jgi:hypothetical protein
VRHNKKEDAMKTRMVFVVLVAAGVVLQQAHAQGEPQADQPVSVFASLSSYQRADLGRIEKSFLFCLDCEVDGVVESAIAELTRLKLIKTTAESERIQEKMADLSMSGRSPSVRYKAYLASVVFDNPLLFAAESGLPFTTQNELFSAIANRLAQSVLVMR